MSTQPVDRKARSARPALRLRRVDAVPENFAELADEVSASLSRIYGVKAAQWYREVAPRALQEAIRQPAVTTLGLFDRTTLAALLIGLERRGVGQISFVHVLSRYANRGLEGRLVRECVRAFRERGVDGVLAEYAPSCPLDLADTYGKLGFTCVPRSLMGTSVDYLLRQPARSTVLSYAVPPSEFTDVADVIVDAYQGHPGRNLHIEVREREHALAYVRQVVDGDFGVAQDGFIRLTRCDGLATGAIMGCEVAPGWGFILQVAIRRAWQGRGLGQQLVQHVAEQFRNTELSHVALGVTLDNPARRLYERLGFEILCPVDAHVWWRTLTAPQFYVGTVASCLRASSRACRAICRK